MQGERWLNCVMLRSGICGRMPFHNFTLRGNGHVIRKCRKVKLYGSEDGIDLSV